MIIAYTENEKDRQAGAQAVAANKNLYGDIRLLLVLAVGFWIYTLLQVFFLEEPNAWIGLSIMSIAVIGLILKIAGPKICTDGDDPRSIEIDTLRHFIKVGENRYPIKQYIETDGLFLIVYDRCYASLSKSKLQELQVQELAQKTKGKS
ncbi:hypothetical protein [Hydrogenimonas sp.]